MNENRFDKKGRIYSASRPSYPDELFGILSGEGIIGKNSVLADIGAGTGIFSAQLSKYAKKVYAVEPNEDMRKAANEFLFYTDNTEVSGGSAENTGLKNGCIDCIAAAQAFHWFDGSLFAKECKRILKPHGAVVLVWNIRDENDPLIKANYEINRVYCDNFTSLGEKTGFSGKNRDSIDSFFSMLGTNAKHITLKNNIKYDLDTFIGRNLSSSYAPIGAAAKGYVKALSDLFSEYENNGEVAYPYITDCFYGKLTV